MTSLLLTAFGMGAIGSIHCIGMCGPIALSLPTVNNNHSSRFLSSLLYNSGRIFTYAILGGIFGSIGMTFHLFGLQQLLSVLLGVLIIFFIFFPSRTYAENNPLAKILKNLRAVLGNLFQKKAYQSIFFIGLLNGLLPCGLVYIAIAGAIESGSILSSSLFMAAFGCGTLPLMWTISFFGGFVGYKIRVRIRKAYPSIAFCIAILLILRGMDLKIPYLSPSVEKNSHIERVECHDYKQLS